MVGHNINRGSRVWPDTHSCQISRRSVEPFVSCDRATDWMLGLRGCLDDRPPVSTLVRRLPFRDGQLDSGQLTGVANGIDATELGDPRPATPLASLVDTKSHDDGQNRTAPRIATNVDVRLRTEGVQRRAKFERNLSSRFQAADVARNPSTANPPCGVSGTIHLQPLFDHCGRTRR